MLFMHMRDGVHEDTALFSRILGIRIQVLGLRLGLQVLGLGLSVLCLGFQVLGLALGCVNPRPWPRAVSP